jgi:DNA-binding NtrC family response regulator
MTESQNEILFIDDDPKAGDLMLRFSEDADYECKVFQDPQIALDYFNENSAAMVITDLRMPGMDGLELLRKLKEIEPDLAVIVMTAYSTVDDAIEAMRLGAADFIKKPYDMDELRLLIEKTLQQQRLTEENRLLKRQLSDERQRFGMLGQSQVMHDVFSIIEKIADIRCNVIIEGETGSGKELAARAIHYQSQSADKPFIVIDCGSLTDTLLESELFGHEKGAFTGAVQRKIGLLEEASGGTVFLDEICNISDAMQTKLLRVVQEQKIMRVGGNRLFDIDVRFVVATNRNLDEMVRKQEFRHDLYHRLNVVNIHMPALRERREDIPLLIQYFIERFAERFHRQIDGFDADSMQRLCEYDWPGNVRELSNLVERHVALASQPVLRLEDLPETAVTEEKPENHLEADMPTLEELERRYILKVLAHFDGNREKTADALGINKSTLWRRLQQYQ